MADAHVRDGVGFDIEDDSLPALFTSMSERSRLTSVEGELSDLLEGTIETAMSTSHYDNGTTYIALLLATSAGRVVFTWEGPGYIPYDLDYVRGAL